MTQSPITVIDGTETAAVARVEINGALEALATLSSGGTAPSTTFSGMFWHDTSTGILKIRSEADDAWINVGYLDQSNNEFKPYVGSTQVDTQSTSTWEAGTSTTEGIVSPAKNKAAFDAFEQQIGVGQTWQDVTASRSESTEYQNTTGKPISVSVTKKAEFGNITLEVSDGSGFVVVAESRINDDFRDHEFVFTIVPDQHYYKANGSGAGFRRWVELR